MYDVTNWETNNYNIHIAQYLKKLNNQTLKLRQFNRINIFFFKNRAGNELGILVPDLFLFFEKVLNEVKASD